MKILSYIHLILYLCIFFSAGAQRVTRELSLNETLDLVEQGNWDILRSREYLEQSQGDLKESRAVFLPSVQLSENFVTTTDPLMVFGFKLKQEITELSDFDPESLNNPERMENFNTRIEVSQPLLNLDGIWKRKAAEAMMENSEESYRWTRNLIRLQAKELYFNLQLAYQQKDVIQKSYDAASANAENAANLFDQGLISMSDLLAARLRMTEYENSMIETENMVFQINSDLRHFLQLPPGTWIVPTDNVDLQQLVLSIPQVSELPENRADIKAFESRLKASEYELRSFQHSNLPRLNLMGSYEWNDQVLFGGSASNYLVGASLQWDIFQAGVRSGKIQKARSSQRIADLNYREKISNSLSEIRQLQNKIHLTSKQLELAKLAENQAEESFKIVSDRYSEGMEKTSDLLRSESNLLSKRLSKLKMQNHYQQLIFHYEVLTDQQILGQDL